MDFKSGDLIFHYQGNYDIEGNFVLQKQIKAKCTGAEAPGKPIVSVLTGAEYLKPGQRFIRVGSVSDTTRQNGMFFDTITAYKPRMVLYDGFNSYSKFSDDYIVDPSLAIAQLGNLSSVYNSNMGGWLTGHKGIYTKSLFADISGNSMFLINEDADNYFYFNGGVMSLGATRFSLKSTNLGILSGSSAQILLGHTTDYSLAKIGLKNDGSGKLASGNISWDTAGNITGAGNWTNTAVITGGTFRTAASGNRVVMDSNGLTGYDNILGTTFSIPTNGSPPTFSSGIIDKTIFKIYTSGLIRTSDTVADGSVNSAGILINNTGIYGCGPNQTSANANFRIYATNGAAYFNGTITANAGTIGGFNIYAGSITATNLGLISGANGMILLGHDSVYASAKIGFKNDGSGKVASGNISWDTSGNIIGAGNWTNTAVITGGTFRTAASGNRVVMDSNGLTGYDTILGTTFSLPTNGDPPMFFAGIINEAEYRIYTSGLIRTSATVANGSASSAGILINSGGIYGCGANQTIGNANVRILATGAAYFSGTITASGGTIGGFTIGGNYFTSNNFGLYSGATSMMLLGHSTDYNLAKIGFRNDGSGKLASGNISWDAAGNITGAGNWTNTAVITGGTLQTAASGKRVVISGADNRINFYSSGGVSHYIETYDDDILLTNSVFQATTFQGSNSIAGTNVAAAALTVGGSWGNFLNKFIVDSNGRITTVNNISAGITGRVLRDNGTSFTPEKLLFADLDSKPTTITGYGITDCVWGSSSQANRYVAATSGGSPTVQLGKRTLTIGSTAVTVYCEN